MLLSAITSTDAATKARECIAALRVGTGAPHFTVGTLGIFAATKGSRIAAAKPIAAPVSPTTTVIVLSSTLFIDAAPFVVHKGKLALRSLKPTLFRSRDPKVLRLFFCSNTDLEHGEDANEKREDGGDLHDMLGVFGFAGVD